MNKKKEKYVDDGHTIYNMNVEGMRGYQKKVENKNNIYINKNEKHAMIKAAFLAYLPKVLIMLICFGIAALLLYLWLMH